MDFHLSFGKGYASLNNSRMGYTDRGYGHTSGRPRASNPATYCSSTVRIRDLRLPGGALIVTVSQHQFVNHPGLPFLLF